MKSIRIDDELYQWLKTHMTDGYSLNNKIRELAGLAPLKQHRGGHFKYPFSKMMPERDYLFDFEKYGWDVDKFQRALSQWNYRNKPHKIIFTKMLNANTYVLTKVR